MKKKFIILVLLTFFFSSNTFAQAPRGFYAAAGINQSTLSSSDLISNYGTGYKVGFVFNFGYHESYNYQIDFFVNQTSFKAKTVDNNLENLRDTKLNIGGLEAGFYFNYYILKPDEDKFFFGPQIGIAFSKIGNPNPSKESDNGNLYLPYLLDDTALTDSSVINLSSGLGLTGGYKNFRFDLRYSKGLTNLLSNVETNNYDESNTYTGPKLNAKLNTFSFSVSYLVF